jgi:hypothetical protein
MKRMLFLCSVLLAAWLGQPSVSAQEPGAKSERSGARSKRVKRAKRDKRAKPPKEEAEAPAEAKPTDKEAAVPSGQGGIAPKIDDKGSASSALGGAEEQVRKEGDTEVKTVEFTGLDIEGQLKTPQLLYFLTRLRAEFDRPRLPHRSFMPELSRTTGEKPLR